MGKIVNFIVGAIAGALVASVVVTLLTPSSGKELQEKVKDYSQNVKDEVQKARDIRREELEKELARLRKPTA
jgi:gas vesicle protein